MCPQMDAKKVVKGNKIKVEYTGTLDDGSVFDSSEKHGTPLEFEAGAGQVIPGFDDAIMGMKVGEEKDVTLPPEQAYGELNPQLRKEIPKTQLPAGNYKKGMMLALNMPDGNQLPATIVAVSDSNITLDFNSPLAGKTLHFKLKVVEIA